MKSGTRIDKLYRRVCALSLVLLLALTASR